MNCRLATLSSSAIAGRGVDICWGDTCGTSLDSGIVHFGPLKAAELIRCGDINPVPVCATVGQPTVGI
jgi:hypothetical protein